MAKGKKKPNKASVKVNDLPAKDNPKGGTTGSGGGGGSGKVAMQDFMSVKIDKSSSR